VQNTSSVRPFLYSPGSCVIVERNNFKYQIWDHDSATPVPKSQTLYSATTDGTWICRKLLKQTLRF